MPGSSPGRPVGCLASSLTRQSLDILAIGSTRMLRCETGARPCISAFPRKDGMLPPSAILRHLEHSDPELIGQLDEGMRGLTIVVGRKAKQLWSSNDVVSGSKWRHQHLIDDILSAPTGPAPCSRALSPSRCGSRQAQPYLRGLDPPDDPGWPPIAINLAGTLIGVDENSIGQLTDSQIIRTTRGTTERPAWRACPR